MSATVVIGVGNPFRRDDGAGWEVARALRARVPDEVEVVELDGEPAALLDAWSGAGTAYVVDAIRSDDAAGTVHRIELDAVGQVHLPTGSHGSSHALGLGEAVALARVLGRLPPRLVLIGITGAAFDVGEGLSGPVRAAVDRVVDELASCVGAVPGPPMHGSP